MIKQMKLSNFCKEYDMSRTTVLDLIYYQHLPGYKIGGRWYIDMKKFIDYGIVAKVLVGCREDPGHKITCYVVNPYIFTRGNRVNLEVLSYFKEAKW